MNDLAVSARALDDLREGGSRFRAVLELTSDWYWEQDAQFRFTTLIQPGGEPQRWARIILGKRRWDIAFDNMTPARWAEHRSVVEAHRPFRELELCRAADSGEMAWFSVSGDPVFDEAGVFRGYRGIGRDITARRRAEEELRKSEQRFKTFMDNAPTVAWIKDAALRYTWLSAPFERMVGRRPEDLLGRDDLEVGWPEEAARITRQHDLAVLEAGTVMQFVESALHPDGTVHHWLIFKFPFPDHAGAPGIAGMSVDVTERINAEKRVRQYSEEIRALCSGLVNTQEAERRRVADDLHDMIGQNLTALGLDLASLKAALPQDVRERNAERIRSMQLLLDDTVEVIRGVMAELRPPGLDELGLVAALHWYVSVYGKRTGIRASLAASDSVRLAPDLEVAIFRIVQEALTNVAKHSQARSVEIALTLEERLAKVSITDDGTGFPDPVGARSARRGGWGLPSMRERVEALGGTLRVDFPARGTRLSVELPATDAY